jgi:hypothetical protein
MRSKLGEHRWEAVEEGERPRIVARIGQIGSLGTKVFAALRQKNGSGGDSIFF